MRELHDGHPRGERPWQPCSKQRHIFQRPIDDADASRQRLILVEGFVKGGMVPTGHVTRARNMR